MHFPDQRWLGLLLVLLLTHSAVSINLRPIIGVVANGPNDTSIFPPYTNHDAYIASSYVKWLEAAGARVVPIPWFLPESSLRALLSQLNGALLPGGGTHFFANGSLSGYGRTTGIIFNESVAAWEQRGEVWPVWGTCLGHEMLLTHAGNDHPAIDEPGWDSENVSYALVFTPAGRASRLWGSAPTAVIAVLETYNVTMNLHDFGVSPARFASTPALDARMAILSTNLDEKGREFVSSSEGKNGLPVFTSQFHPEKVAFEWWTERALNHTAGSIEANMWPAKFFVQQARQNSRSFANFTVEASALIYNYPAIYTGASGLPGYEQVQVAPLHCLKPLYIYVRQHQH